MITPKLVTLNRMGILVTNRFLLLLHALLGRSVYIMQVS